MGDSMDEYLDIVSNTFASEDDGFHFYNNCALEKGFSVQKLDESNQETILR